jgi:hypothetical protein
MVPYANKRLNIENNTLFNDMNRNNVYIIYSVNSTSIICLFICRLRSGSCILPSSAATRFPKIWSLSLPFLNFSNVCKICKSTSFENGRFSPFRRSLLILFFLGIREGVSSLLAMDVEGVSVLLVLVAGT